MIYKFQSFRSIILLAVGLFPIIASAQMAGAPDKMSAAIQIIKYAYVDTVNEKQLTDEAIRAMIKQLDPHSVYIPVEELSDANEPLNAKFTGVGIQFNINEDTIMVTQTIPGGPSEKLGIHAGDRIVKIDDSQVAGVKITNNDVKKKLRGPKGTKVKVDIYRRGEKDLIDFTITRDEIPIFSIDASYMVTPKIGYIKISRFADSTVDEFKEALAKLKKEGLESLILDLEGNGGGYLNRAVELADEFLADGKKIVYTRGRNVMSEDYMSSPVGGWEKGKLAILIDETSASASEIVSGAIQDWDRGLIIGRRSFGKGLVQKPYQLPDGSAIRLTVAHYYTPSGRCIQKPYELGDEDEYDSDINNRYKHGELFYADSIHFLDSTNYFTGNHRMVKGGGGIMPDVFVPLDTTENSQYHTDLIRKNVLGDFTLNYADNHRAQLLSKYPNITAFKKNFTLTDDIMDEFIKAGEKADLKRDEAGLKVSGKLMRIQLKALIARNLWDSDAYFEVINDENASLQKAIQAINDNTFEKLKIAAK